MTRYGIKEPNDVFHRIKNRLKRIFNFRRRPHHIFSGHVNAAGVRGEVDINTNNGITGGIVRS